MMRATAVAVLLSVGAACPTFAQSSSPSVQQRSDNRVRLEAQALAAEQAGRTSEAWLLRTRLRSGDFQEGDRIVVILESGSGAGDTLQVRAGKVLRFPRMEDLSLEGVLRSELNDTVRQHLARFLTNPGVRAVPLLPLAVLGAVRNPGFYYSPADAVLRDVVMRAGGPNPDAELTKATIRRAGQTIWGVSDVRIALSDGVSLDGLHLRAGDEIVVPQQGRLQAATILSLVTGGLAAVVAIVQLQR